MQVRSSLKLAAAAAGVALGLAGSAARAADAAPASGPSQQELQDQIRQLRDQIDRLESKQSAASKAAVDGAQVDAAIAGVVRDSQQRGQFMAPAGFTAGYTDGKFVIQSEDGKFRLNPNAQFQFRYAANFRQESKNGVAESDDIQSGFEARRLKISFDGNLWGPDLTYKLQWATSRSTGNLQLDEGWVRYQFAGTPFAVRGGTFLDGWDHETGVSSKRQLAVERSIAHEIFASAGTSSESYVQGVEAIYDDGGPLRGSVSYNDGLNSRNTDFRDGSGGAALLGLTGQQGAVSGRVEYKIFGDWKNYDDFTALDTKKDLLVVGGGAHVEFADNLTAYLHTVDVQYEPAAVPGLGLYAAYTGLYRDFRTVGAGIEGNPYDWGFVAQASYLLDDQWEVFARYSYVGLDDQAPTGTGSLGAAARVEDQLHEITVGANYYLKKHAAKFTVDAVYLPNGSPIDLNGANILPQTNDKSQFVLRAQFQLLL